MTKRQITLLIDDIDGEVIEEGGVTVPFSYAGRDYTIDLSDSNAAQFQETLAPYLDAARVVRRNGGGNGKARTRSSTPTPDLKTVRAWANEHGYTLGDRGRIPIQILEAYEAAQG